MTYFHLFLSYSCQIIRSYQILSALGQFNTQKDSLNELLLGAQAQGNASFERELISTMKMLHYLGWAWIGLARGLCLTFLRSNLNAKFFFSFFFYLKLSFKDAFIKTFRKEKKKKGVRFY